MKIVDSYIAKGIEEGATVLAGGRPEPPEKGYFINPTVFTDVTNDMTIAQEEIFGPVLCVITYDGVDQALAIANDTKYGLNGAVWGPDKEEATKVAEGILSGNVYVNGSRATSQRLLAALRTAVSAVKAAKTGCSNLQNRKLFLTHKLL